MQEIDVLIIMGSISDQETMRGCREILEEFGIPYAFRVASAHRGPDRVREVVKEAEVAGCKVFICGAGKAAHLAGAVAGITIKPVIGVPLTPKSPSGLNGLDALLSTVQMPSGVPVATVALDGAKNAAILAIEILAVSHTKLTF